MKSMTMEKSVAKQQKDGSGAPGPVVRASGLKKYFRRVDGTEAAAVNDVSFELQQGEFMVLLGPSGCGKTTLLRMVAGLEVPDEGTVEIDGRTVFSREEGISVPPERRQINMIFQSYALWPHMTVAQNVGYPLRSRSEKLSQSEIAERVANALDLVHIRELSGQYPDQMSGGQQQRVALARALVSGTNLVLFDEPLSNVDAHVREQLRSELVHMQRDLGFSAIYVTHDQQEAMGLAHRIAVMRTGEFAQVGSPREVYHEATSRYVANFVGVSNELPGRITSVNADDGVLDTAVGSVAGRVGSDLLAAGDAVTALFRPERASVSMLQGKQNSLPGVIEAALFLGPHTEYEVQCGDHRFRIWENDIAQLEVGAQVFVNISPDDVRLLAS
ncbi:ABC transporter ATP-binding protein [Glaciibacter superstes]|uniref:ABC transporter ATP-binding protein n=1 Tax=Glaciibacter superstes TaxID=501023 RepID=UPI0003B51877|nr:ABC transporter ATP-binding protein [Glaciibacter superstes]